MSAAAEPGAQVAARHAGGAAPAGRGALAGLRVVELSAIGPVPLAGMLLADHGADVVRFDRLEPSGLGVPTDTAFDVPARGKRSLALDLKRPEGVAIARRLIGTADVLLEGWRPGVAERLGLDPQALLAANPRLIVGRMTGYGQDGPWSQVAGHDLNFIALSGALEAIGPASGSVPPLNLVADYGGGTMLLAFGVLAALHERSQSGRGQVVDAAMVEGSALLLSMAHGLRAAGQWQPQRAANLLDGGAPFYACYPTADGRQLAVGALEPRFFATLLQTLGLDAGWRDRQHDRSGWPRLRQEIAHAIAQRPLQHWAERFAGVEACVTPVLTMAEAAEHPQAQARDGYASVDGVVQPMPAPRLSRSGAVPPQPPRPEGADAEAVLAEAGCSAAEIAAWRAQGVLR